MLGKKKLEERVRKGNIHISPADKGKGMVAMSLTMYEEMVEEHTKNKPKKKRASKNPNKRK